MIRYLIGEISIACYTPVDICIRGFLIDYIIVEINGAKAVSFLYELIRNIGKYWWIVAY